MNPGVVSLNASTAVAHANDLWQPRTFLDYTTIMQALNLLLQHLETI
jgi:hypothetical protein